MGSLGRLANEGTCSRKDRGGAARELSEKLPSSMAWIAEGVPDKGKELQGVMHHS